MERLLQCGISCSRDVSQKALLCHFEVKQRERKGGQNLSFSGSRVLMQNLFILTYIGWVV